MKTILDPRFPSEEYEEYDEKPRHDFFPMKHGIARRQNLESPWDLEKNIRRNSWDGTLKPASGFEEVTSSDLEGKMCEKCERNKRIAYSWNPAFLCLPWLEWMYPIGFVVIFVFSLVVMTVSDANEIKGPNPSEDISKTPLAGMTHIDSFDLRHADLNATMPWLCTKLQSMRHHKGCYDITWLFGSYAGWSFLAYCWMHFSAISFSIVGASCLLYAVIWHHSDNKKGRGEFSSEKTGLFV
ncbi:uncharacterized protein Bfra_011887 [Botrytis fragariae]|uniref:Uncharacterized protein n=1 Tax=Botrytis fragariae TaxID=1964551 RepID=A0A8H6EE34_9HELO|nr:uncharacterized protein Bfra_011887 [Botrytis fragariae]KAF5868922.1 hypothetical protein Bfra_011887 [Botrytis fragariae]